MQGLQAASAIRLEVDPETAIFECGIDRDVDAFELVAYTWPGYALAGFYLEQGVMCRTLYKRFVHIEELVFLPVQAGTGMRTAIDVAIELPVFMDNKNVSSFFANLDAECLATRVFNFIAVAKRRSQSIAQKVDF